MEELEQKFINFYEKYLAKEAEEICKEVEQLNKDEKKFIINKANEYANYCYNFLRHTMDKDLFERCMKFEKETDKYNDFVNIFKKQFFFLMYLGFHRVLVLI